MSKYDVPEVDLTWHDDPQCAPYFQADCGHELYEGEKFIEFNGKTWCDDCFRDEIGKLDAFELAQLVGGEVIEVNFNV